MKYQIILYDLPNGTTELEGLVIDYKPPHEAIDAARILYGAKRYELREIEEAAG